MLQLSGLLLYVGFGGLDLRASGCNAWGFGLRCRRPRASVYLGKPQPDSLQLGPCFGFESKLP